LFDKYFGELTFNVLKFAGDIKIVLYYYKDN